MRLPKRRRRLLVQKGRKRSRALPIFIVSVVCMIALLFYTVNVKLMPTYLRYAEVQTNKIASHVISQAINSRTANVLDVNDIMEDVPSNNSGGVTTKFNTEIINRVMAETHKLVQTHLEESEEGNLSHLPQLENIEYDADAMQQDGGVVFFVPIGQATNIPLLGNLGPKIPIRFHVIGSVHTDVESYIQEFGINNAYVEVRIHITVNVQIIVPLATKSTTVEQRIPVAIGLINGKVPNIYTKDGGTQPSIEVPVKLD
ncbi:sporulation protein YunB [Viridibacillus sp. YIM B01967]|uniref:Sporulation protein YunB n=1 Tax=Viridibacillus soli TaxID=2798301 RepID=A0ABS1H9S1_9BACL|nr:sporulation protein YunB [Viridibacillus soli]MBK3496159.1 sporulation protein YunB [Viridibacillus soli]